MTQSELRVGTHSRYALLRPCRDDRPRRRPGADGRRDRHRPEVQKTAYSRFMTASMPMFWGNVQSK
jgi:hypothetical protein